MRTPRTRRGLTLVELMVVIVIIVLVTAAALPIARTGLQDRKVREGARSVASYFKGAQARAAQLNRPVGVWIERDPFEHGTANGHARAARLFMAEEPPPYVGDTIGARAFISQQNGIYTVTFEQQQLMFSVLVEPGDHIRFDYKGPRYRIVEVTGDGCTIEVAGGQPQPIVTGAGNGARALPFQVYRQPRRSIVSPLELPSGIVIDLTVSGIAPTGRDFAPDVAAGDPFTDPPNDGMDYGPIVVMFHPNGTVKWVYYMQPSDSGPFFGPVHPLDSIHLLVGRNEQVYDYDEPPKTVPSLFSLGPDDRANLMDLSNLWVSINHRTGAVRTSEMADSRDVPDAVKLSTARQFTRSTLALGGR